MFGFLKSLKGSQVAEVSCADALAQARRREIHLIDVRERAEWDQGHVAGSVSAPLSTLDVAALPSDKPLVFLCVSGRRSATAARQAMDVGRSSSNVAGGLVAWRAAGLPMTIA